MIASFPAAQLPEVLEGLADAQKRGRGLPLALPMPAEYPMAPSYVRIGQLMGMDWVK